ncbi:hypothetical protein N7457_002585 [Penicillium paradoxum]|uniref:uncharacterized protein n=1 Tax=Penicillium paradoxum TaxID=176176 RepID=UPI002546C818|nr:uncharacterized protein N7457_002585 [Penicillium paradoxum]KAJ5787595.1 hypothetical protein N7457_002585 [Penicillium paradoxum]
MSTSPSINRRNEARLVVRCDRRDPCGNCQDAGISCDRRRAVKRKCLSTRPQRDSSHSPARSLRQQISPSRHSNNAIPSQYHVVPAARLTPCDISNTRGLQTRTLYDPVHDAQLTIQHQLWLLPGLTLDRRAVLETALSTMRTMADTSRSLVQSHHSDQQEGEYSRIPSAETLTWMLKDIHTDRFGSFVADYFRHISKLTLKKMGLALLRKEVSSHECIIYSVCLNSIAYKFMTTVVNLEEDTDLALELRKTAIEYRAAAQAALRQIPLLFTPSLGSLQAILCGVFLHQGSGDVGLCGDLTKAACNTCIALDLQKKALDGNITEEELFCFLWCYILDRNYAFKSRTSRCLLNRQLPLDFSALHNPHIPMAEHFSIYLDLARVQDTLISYLPDGSLSHHNTSQYAIQEHMLVQMQYIEQRILKIASLSTEWKGLDSQTEMSALKFAYQSVMTGILYLIQPDPNQPTVLTHTYLQSARQELSELVSMCHSAEKQTAVSFLNWTILLYPATAYLILFCNVIATSDLGDFNLMQAIADCLPQTGISDPLIQLRSLFTNFLGLSQRFFNDERNLIQRNRSPRMQSPLSYPIDPHPWSWDTNEFLLDQFLFTGSGEYFDMANIPETDVSLPYSNSGFE